MTQVLHIFRKDLRRHWPEILISLALLALFTRHELRLWQEAPGSISISPLYFLLSWQYIPFLLVLSWIFLVLRVVQGETLVGDRQWWVTKPYVWWELLLSKLFFFLVFISVPLFHVQLLLLHNAGFPILPNLGKVVLMQLGLPVVLIICSFGLASITKNLAQALLGIGIVVVVLIIGQSLDSFFSLSSGDAPPLADWTESLLVFASIVIVPVWQYARRRTWTSRITMAAGLGSATVLSLIPFGSRVEQTYPLLAMKASPVQITVAPLEEPAENAPGLLSFASEAVLSIPVNVTGVAPGSLVLVERMKITVDSGEDSAWARGWTSEYEQLWPESPRQILRYEIQRKQYEKIKTQTLNLRVQLALSEYQEAEPRTLTLPAGIFRDPDLGLCRLTVFVGRQQLECLKPFHSPAYMARFDAPSSLCGSVRTFPNSLPANIEVAYAWDAPSDEVFPDPGLNPVDEYQVTFISVPRISKSGNSSRVDYSGVTLCPGAELRFAHPVLKRHFRVELELPATRLEDLVVRPPLFGER